MKLFLMKLVVILKKSCMINFQRPEYIVCVYFLFLLKFMLFIILEMETTKNFDDKVSSWKNKM